MVRGDEQAAPHLQTAHKLLPLLCAELLPACQQVLLPRLLQGV
jgi:hypothetical protein